MILAYARFHKLNIDFLSKILKILICKKRAAPPQILTCHGYGF